MKYLKSFPKQLRFFRETHKLSVQDVADLCGVDASVVAAWEQDSPNTVYPNLENLLDICFKTGAALEYFVDVPSQKNNDQLELPGLSSDDSDGDELHASLEKLDQQLKQALPKEQELELIRRFRKSDEQNRELILQLMGM